jgi:hypothetical protein
MKKRNAGGCARVLGLFFSAVVPEPQKMSIAVRQQASDAMLARLVAISRSGGVLEFLAHNCQGWILKHFVSVHKVEWIRADFSQLRNDVGSILDPAFDCLFGEMSRLGYELPAIAQIDRTFDGELCTRARRVRVVGSFARRPSKAPKFE